jgi:hypothetical protein
MNIFYIDKCPIKSARQLADQHICKMQIESAQMLCTAHWELGSSAPYKRAHTNHPSTKWARQSIENYRWLVEHGLEIAREFTRRYGKVHKTQSILEWLKANEPQIKNSIFTEPPQCMPDLYKMQDTIGAYRNFYIEEKVKLKKLSWKKLNNIPDWIKFDLTIN